MSSCGGRVTLPAAAHLGSRHVGAPVLAARTIARRRPSPPPRASSSSARTASRTTSGRLTPRRLERLSSISRSEEVRRKLVGGGGVFIVSLYYRCTAVPYVPPRNLRWILDPPSRGRRAPTRDRAQTLAQYAKTVRHTEPDRTAPRRTVPLHSVGACARCVPPLVPTGASGGGAGEPPGPLEGRASGSISFTLSCDERRLHAGVGTPLQRTFNFRLRPRIGASSVGVEQVASTRLGEYRDALDVQRLADLDQVIDEGVIEVAQVEAYEVIHHLPLLRPPLIGAA